MTLEELLAPMPANYRLYKIDASIEGRFSVMLALKGQDRDDWFASGEVLDKSGKDVRPELYVYGVAASLSGAIMEAIGNARP